MKEDTCKCARGIVPTLIFSCSGAADVGEISDRAARLLTREGAGTMFCLAGIGGHINNILISTQAAGKILVIDGCPADCARKTMEHAGFDSFIHLRVTEFGFTKGKTPPTDEVISSIVAQGKKSLGVIESSI